MRNSTRKAIAAIYSQIELLHKLLLSAQSVKDELKKATEELDVFDKSNLDLFDKLHDFMENFKAWFALVAILVAGSVDFFLFKNAISVISGQGYFSSILKVVVPFFLILLEIIVSYVCLTKKRDGEWTSWASNLLQYFIFGILFAFCVSSCASILPTYNQDIDGSRIVFYLGNLTYQFVLLASSILLQV